MIDNYDTYKAKVLGDCSYFENITTITPTVPLAPLPVPAKKNPYLPAENKKQEQGNNPMEEKTYYLQGRLHGIYNDKNIALGKQFGIYDDATPQTVEDLLKRIEDGHFVVSEDKMKYRTSRPLDCITWRNPEVKKDQEGYETALKALGKAKVETNDQIMSGDYSVGLKAIQEFENFTFKTKK